MQRICMLIDQSGVHNCDICTYPPNHGVSMYIEKTNNIHLITVGTYKDGGDLRYLHDPDIVSQMEIRGPTLHQVLTATDFLVGLVATLAVLTLLDVYPSNPILALTEENINNIESMVEESDVFIFHTVMDVIVEFKQKYAKLFISKKKLYLTKMEDIEERTEIALEEIDRKLGSAVDDIDDATQRLQDTCDQLANKVSTSIQEQCDAFGHKLDEMVAVKVKDEVVNQTQDQISNISNRLDALTSRVDKVLNLLNLLK